MKSGNLSRADNDSHWSVFWASFAVVLVTWGLVPMQAGIFAVRTITRTSNMTFTVSTAAMPYDKQATSLTFRYMQSTYGIASLNETLPAYMTHNYTLAPFEPFDSLSSGLDGQGNYTAPTTMYQLDLKCEDASRRGQKLNSSEILIYKSSNGCNCTTGLDGNVTVGDSAYQSKLLAVREYTGRYVGYHNGGWADWYLSSDCPKAANTTFFAAFEKSKVGKPQTHFPLFDLLRRRERKIPLKMSPLYSANLSTGDRRFLLPSTDLPRNL
jgi:hypothetical protein